MGDRGEEGAGLDEDELQNPEEEDRESEFVEVDPSKRYGRYDEVLGKGAFKTVYRAFDEELGIEVAWNQVKVQDVLQSPEDLERLYSEVHLLKTLRHKNIIKFYNSWVDAKTKNVNFITEIFTSGTLRQYRKKHKHCDLKAVKNWSRQILRGLLYLHSHDPPIIHRDLKCDNIFVNGNQGEVKIGDLGLAAILRQAHAAHSVIGTPEFMAPELYEEEYNELVDIYSFGMCLLEMVTFEYPYSECINAAQIYKKVTTGRKPAALDKVKDPQVRAFVEKCLDAASRRLPARELLMDPFLNDDLESNNHQIPRTDSRPDELEMLNFSHDEPVPRMLALPDPRSQARDSRDMNANGASSSDLKSTAEMDDEEKQSDNVAVEDSFDVSAGGIPRANFDEQAGGDNSRKSDRSRTSRDFKVKGKKNDEDEKIYLRLRIADAKGHVRNIHFPFDIEVDTAVSVASEMVAELDLSDQDVSNIAEMIDAEIMALVPDWHPGGTLEYGVAGSGDLDAENLHQQSEDERAFTEQEDEGEHLVTMSSTGSLISPTPGRGRSQSPARSRSRSRSRPNSRGFPMSPSRVSLGASSPRKGYGITHGRFWENIGQASEVLRFFSSDESDDLNRREISPVLEDDGEEPEDGSDSPHSSIRSLTEQVERLALVAYSEPPPSDAAGQLKKGDHLEALYISETGHNEGKNVSIEGGWSGMDPKRRSFTDTGEFRRGDLQPSPHGHRSDYSSPPPRHHGKAGEGLPRAVWSRQGSRGSGDVEDEEDDGDDENSEIMEEEEKLKLERERAIWDLERYYDNKLIAVRNKHRRHHGENCSSHSGQQAKRREKGRERESHYREHRVGLNGVLNGFSTLEASREREISLRKSPTPPPLYDEYSGSGRTTPNSLHHQQTESPDEDYARVPRRQKERDTDISYGRKERERLLRGADVASELVYPLSRGEHGLDPVVGRRDSRESRTDRFLSRPEVHDNSRERSRREQSKERSQSRSQQRSKSPLPDSLIYSGEGSTRLEGPMESNAGRWSDYDMEMQRDNSFRNYGEVGGHVPRPRGGSEIMGNKGRESGLEEYHGMRREGSESHMRRHMEGEIGGSLGRDVTRDPADSISSRREGEDRRDSGSSENGYSWRDRDREREREKERERDHGRSRDIGRERELPNERTHLRELRKERERERAIERDRDRGIKKDAEREPSSSGRL